MICSCSDNTISDVSPRAKCGGVRRLVEWRRTFFMGLTRFCSVDVVSKARWLKPAYYRNHNLAFCANDEPCTEMGLTSRRAKPAVSGFRQRDRVQPTSAMASLTSKGKEEKEGKEGSCQLVILTLSAFSPWLFLKFSNFRLHFTSSVPSFLIRPLTHRPFLALGYKQLGSATCRPIAVYASSLIRASSPTCPSQT